ncbi:MAG: YHYH protein [Verrucomicrobiota bacterium]|nr:YHYH protein [Verrucomicrobiota bacterium]
MVLTKSQTQVNVTIHFTLLAILTVTATSTYAHPKGSYKHQPANQSVGIQHYAEFIIKEGKRIVQSNGIPKHAVGTFPNRGNPHTIKPQRHHYECTLSPKLAQSITPINRQPFGIALNGVLFDPGTAEFFRGDHHSEWKLEAMTSKMARALDANHAHVQPSGAYHYHGVPSGLISRLTEDSRSMVLIGWAADGFPIYSFNGYKDSFDSNSPLVELRASYQIRKGNRPIRSNIPQGTYNGNYTLDWVYVAGSGDLDACNGRHGVTPEFPKGIYYYVITRDFPFIPRSFIGTPDPSFLNRRSQQNRMKVPLTSQDQAVSKMHQLQPKGH